MSGVMVHNRISRANGFAILCGAFLFVSAMPALAQWESKSSLSAVATVRLVAIKPSEISVSVHQVPLAFDFDPLKENQPLAFPITTRWNINPNEVRGFEVVAYFSDPAHALIGKEEAIPSRYILGRVDGNAFSAFDQSNRLGPSGSSLRLLTERISPGNALGHRDQTLEVRLDDNALSDVPAARYSGVLLIEARYY